MGNESHREYKQKWKNKQRFQNQWSWTRIIDTESLFGILDGFRYPLVMKSCFFFVFLVFSMVLATHWLWKFGFLSFLVLSMVLAIHWFWNLGCVGFIHGFWLPSDSFWLTCACWKCCFAIAKQRINLKTCIWPRRNACFEKWCFPSIKQHTCWNWASRLGGTHF